MSRFAWTPENVSATKSAARSIRTYIEQAQLRHVLGFVTHEEGDLHTIAEVGCGFGRLLPVLHEFGVVTGYEREPDLVKQAKRYLPWAMVERVESLEELPPFGDGFDLVMSFTVLQHMSDLDALGTISEMKRIARRDLLIVEDTDPAYHFQDKSDRTHFTHGRPINWYAEAAEPFQLWQTWPREVEPTYKKKAPPIVGDYMLFRRAQ